MRIEIFLGLLIWLCCSIATADVPYGESLASPNGRFAVQLEKDDQGSYFNIRDNKTGHVDKSINMPTVLLFLRWTQNSQRIVTVEHLAGGSFAGVIYFDGAKWRFVNYLPQGKERMEFQVTKIAEGPKVICLEYVVTREEDNRYPIGDDLYEVHINLTTGEALDEKWIPISETESETLMSKAFVYEEGKCEQ